MDAAEAAGCKVVEVISMVDRREDGSDAIRRRGYVSVALFEADRRREVAPVVTWHFSNGLLWSGQGGRREEFCSEGSYRTRSCAGIGLAVGERGACCIYLRHNPCPRH